MDDFTLGVVCIGAFVALLVVGLFFLTSVFGIHSVNGQAQLATEHPGWSSRQIQLVSQGRIAIGMTQEMVLESLGRPGDVVRNVSTSGVSESWTYYTANEGDTVLSIVRVLLGKRPSLIRESIEYILYFQNGTLTSWSEF